ncbi:hypothetical protein [Streptomyces sp. NPDC058373]|uniref:hypothetical protein n=1 Tax=Streptomyces sp. NPDC058373 TaxID=3346465 RepID=UPI003656C684
MSESGPAAFQVDEPWQRVGAGNELTALPLRPDDLRFYCDNWENYHDAVAALRP